jgi:PAS domain S-box-containing protein
VRLSLCAALSGPGSAWALDPSKALTQYVHDAWTLRDGLPGDAVYDILQSPEGYLWLRTSAGLARFDGIRFSSLAVGVAGAPGGPVRAVGRGADGSVLVRTATETLRYEGGRFSRLLPPSTLEGAVRAIFQSRSGRVWVGADDFIYRVDPQGLTLVRQGTGWVFGFHEDRRGRLWIGTSTGLFRQEDGTAVPHRGFPGPDATAFEEDEGGLWVGTRRGLFRLDPEGHASKPAGQPNPSPQVTVLLRDRNGNLWVGTDASGLWRLSRGRWSMLTVREGLDDDGILSLLEDREGSLWIGTKGGLERLRDPKVTPVTMREGLANDNVAALLEARDGSLYVFSDGGGLTRFKDGVASVFTTRQGLPSDFGGALYEARDGSIFVGTSRGLGRFKDGAIAAYSRGRLRDKGVSAVNEDDEGLILATHDAVVHRLRGDRALEYTVRGKPTPFTGPGNYVYTMKRNDHGVLWFGTYKGLFRSPEPGRFEGPETTGIAFPVTALHEDDRGSLWVAGRAPGLVRLRLSDGLKTRYTAAQGLLDDEIRSVLTDPAGNVWASTPRGLFTVSRSDLDAFADARIPAVRSVVYDVTDGMKTREAAAPEHQPAGWACRDGRLLFATRKGFVVVDPERLPRNDFVPPVLIEEVLADRQPLARDGPVDVGAGRTSWEFRYTALSLLVPERVRFRYRLEGYDADWTDAGGRRTAYYTKLPAGRYRFHVLAANDDGVWNARGASFTFVLRPRFRDTPWFYAASAVVALVLASGAHHLRTKRLQAGQAHLQELVDRQTRELNAEVLERTRSEAALREERAILDAVLDQIPDHVYFKDSQGRFTRINRAQATWLGLDDPQHALGKTDFEFFGPEHAEGAAADEAEIMRTGSALAGKEEKETWPDGRATWVLTTKMPLRDGEGRVVGTMGISRDITARKQLEEELGRYRERLEADVAARTSELNASRQLLKSILDASTAVIYVKDRDGRYVLVNRRHEELFHVDRVSIVGKTDYDLFPKERADAFRAFDQRVLAAGRALEAEELAPQDDGLHTYISIKAPLLDDHGRPYAVCGVSTDITERKRANEALARQHAELGELLGKEQTSRRLAERLRAATQALSASMDPQEVFRLILDELRRVLPCDCASVQELREGQFVVVGGYGFPDPPATIGLRFDLGDPDAPNGEVARRRQPVILDDAPLRYPSFRSGMPAGAGIHSWIGVPLLFGDRLLGMLTVDKREPNFYTKEHARVALAFAAQAAIAMENARLYAAAQGELAERKRVEEALRKAEQKYRAIFENAQEGIFQSTPQGRIVTANPALSRMFGYASPEELTAETTDVASQLYVDPGRREDFKRALETEGTVQGFVHEARRKDGKTIWLSVGARLVRDEEGAPLFYEGTAEDITERTRAAEAEAELKAALEAAAVEWESTFDAMATPVLILDRDGRIVRLNRAAREAAGAAGGELVGRHVADVGPGEPWQKAAELARRDGGTLKAGHDTVRDLASARTWDVTTGSVSGLGAGHDLIVVVARDITRMIELQESLRRSETMSAMGMLVAGVAHEVRNPLFGISANLDAFEARTDTREEFGRFIGLMRGEVQRLATLMQGLLDYGKPSALAPSPGRIEEVVAEACARCDALARRSGVRLVSELGSDLVPILMRRQRLVQVVENLVQNAIQNASAGGVVTTKAAMERDPPTGDQVVLTVSDTGPGFAPVDLPRVFEPFFSRRRGGTGLGLAIVERLVVEHGGTISAANRPEGGAMMVVKLPCQEAGKA